VNTRAYRTHANYANGRINGWVSSQELMLQSSDTAQLTSLVGELQERLLVRAMTFNVSKAMRKKIEDELIGEAMEAFRRRAELVRKHMEDRSYRIVEVHVNTSFAGRYRPMVEADTSRMRAAASAVAQPAVQSGNRDIQVSVSGSVEFQLP